MPLNARRVSHTLTAKARMAIHWNSERVERRRSMIDANLQAGWQSRRHSVAAPVSACPESWSIQFTAQCFSCTQRWLHLTASVMYMQDASTLVQWSSVMGTCTDRCTADSTHILSTLKHMLPVLVHYSIDTSCLFAISTMHQRMTSSHLGPVPSCALVYKSQPAKVSMPAHSSFSGESAELIGD
jgi:hypothetical protein